MRFTKRRTEYLLRRWVGKQAVAVLGETLAVDRPADRGSLARIEVANRPTGEPYVLVDGVPAGLSVSLTDRAGWAVCVIGPDRARVGCDLELVEPRTAGFVDDVLTGAEQRHVERAATEGQRDEAANLLWSAKESALKVLGTGLRRDTGSVQVELADPAPDATGQGWSALRVAVAGDGELPGWWRRDGRFVLTVVADERFPSPEPLPGSARLQDAAPLNSWLERPLAPG